MNKVSDRENDEGAATPPVKTSRILLARDDDLMPRKLSAVTRPTTSSIASQ